MNKILVVDDEEDIREIVSMVLETHFDCEVVESYSGNDAIRIIKENKDLKVIICDYRMPDGNGGDVYKFLRQENIEIPYIMISSDDPQ